MQKTLLIVIGIIALCGSALAQGVIVPFDAAHWDLDKARVVEQTGRQAVAGWQLYSGDGNYLVSHNEGRLFRVTPSGAVTKILDTTTIQMNLADFAYIPESGLLVVPTYAAGRVAAFKPSK